MVEKELYWVQIFNMDIFTVLRVLLLSKPEIQILAVGLRVFLRECVHDYVCVHMCYPHTTKIKYSSDSKFGILHFYHI